MYHLTNTGIFITWVYLSTTTFSWLFYKISSLSYQFHILLLKKIFRYSERASAKSALWFTSLFSWTIKIQWQGSSRNKHKTQTHSQAHTHVTLQTKL